MAFKKKLYECRPRCGSDLDIEIQRTRRRTRKSPCDPLSLERGVRQLLADKVQGNFRPPDIAPSWCDRFGSLNSQAETEMGTGEGDSQVVESLAQRSECRGAMRGGLRGNGHA